MTIVQLTPMPFRGPSRPRVHLFGQLHIEGAVIPTASKPRTILALMMVNAGNLVSRDALIYELWGDKPPKSCVETMQTYLYHIRQHRSATICNNGIAYGLEVDPAEVDALLLQQLVRQAKEAMRSRRFTEAKNLLTRAEALHEGQPFLLDVECGSSLTQWSHAINDVRQTARLRWIQLAMREGLHADILDDLCALWRQDVQAEDITGLLMLALYRMPRAKAALEVYAATRNVLREELGIDPSGLLQDLHTKILQGSRELLETDYLP